MSVMSAPLLAKLKSSIDDPAAGWVLQSAMISQRVETTTVSDGLGGLQTSSITVNNDTYRIYSEALGKLFLIFLTEYTPSEIRAISLTYQGVTLTTTDQALLDKLKAMASPVAANLDAALIAALTLPST